MKSALLGLFLIPLLTVSVFARSPRPQMDVTEYAVEIATSSKITASSSTAKNVCTEGVFLSSATMVEIYNADASAYLNYGYESNVSTDNTTAAFGREIAPKTGIYLGINHDKICPYIKTQSATDTVVVITKMR